MPIRTGSWKSRISFILPCILLSLLLSTAAGAQSQSDLGIMQLKAVFNVSNSPEAPYHAHQSMLLFEPGAEAALHSHGGHGYITILSGELTLYEDGEENVYQAGESLVETTDKLYKGGNYTEDDTILMVTYLVPHGEELTTIVDDSEAPEPPEITPRPIAESVYEFTDPPESFDLVHTTERIEPSSAVEPTTASGDTLLTVVSGELEISVNGDSVEVGTGHTALIEKNQEYTLHSAGEGDALMMSTELVPDVHSIAPAAGSTVDRTLAIWLFVMTGLALLVVGGVVRLTGVRMR